MLTNTQFSADLLIFTKKSLRENFIFCAVSCVRLGGQVLFNSFRANAFCVKGASKL